MGEDPKPKYYDEKAKARSMRYMKESREKLTLCLPIGTKDRYKKLAAMWGYSSITAMFADLVKQRELSSVEKEESK